MLRFVSMLAVALAVSHDARADAPTTAATPTAAPMTAAAATGAPPAGARETETPPNPASTPAPVGGQRFVGIGAEFGFGIGIGAALHLGTRQVGVFVEAGALPIFVVGNQQTSRALTFDVYGAFELNANLYAMLFQPSPRTDLGLTAGYSGNTVLGNGVNLGVAARYDLAEKLALTIFGGFEIFPDAHDHLLAHGYSSMIDPSIPQIQGGANLGLVFYP